MKLKHTFSAPVLALASLFSCLEEEGRIDPKLPVTIQFGESLSVAENETEHEIIIEFSKAATRSGQITMEVESDFSSDFQTVPLAAEGKLVIEVSEGDLSASIKLIPIDNGLLDGDKSASFKISEVTEGFVIGTKNSVPITIYDDESPVMANFAISANSMNEVDQSTPLTLNVMLSSPAPGSGTVTMQLSQQYDPSVFTSAPSLSADGEVVLSVEPGANTVTLLLYPINNSILNGHQFLSFSIVSTSGVIEKGSQLSYPFTILDDELFNKPMFFESVGGGWRAKKSYEYDMMGRVTKVLWETETPFLRTGTDTYFYDAVGKIERVNHFLNHDEHYFWQDGKVIRSEAIENGIKKSYAIYEYDQAGNIGGKATYYLQSDGSYKQSLTFVYLYFNDGNLYKQLTYIPSEGEEYVLLSTRTYEGYLNVSNPFPVFEIVPTISAQTKLPSVYRIEENGVNLVYNFSYQVNASGLPISRSANSETTTYAYY